jgi:hypothetical protein
MAVHVAVARHDRRAPEPLRTTGSATLDLLERYQREQAERTRQLVAPAPVIRQTITVSADASNNAHRMTLVELQEFVTRALDAGADPHSVPEVRLKGLYGIRTIKVGVVADIAVDDETNEER